MAPSPAVDDRCPRCGGAFHCGMNDASPCRCTTLALASTTMAALRERYTTCLCLRCLRQLQQPLPADVSPPSQ